MTNKFKFDNNYGYFKLNVQDKATNVQKIKSIKITDNKLVIDININSKACSITGDIIPTGGKTEYNYTYDYSLSFTQKLFSKDKTLNEVDNEVQSVLKELNNAL